MGITVQICEDKYCFWKWKWIFLLGLYIIKNKTKQMLSVDVIRCYPTFAFAKLMHVFHITF